MPEFLRDIWRFFYTYKTVGCFWPRSWVQCLKTMRRNKLKVRVLKIPFLPFWSHKTETVFVCFCFFLNKRNIYWWDQPSFMRMANCTGQKKHIFALRCFCSAGKLIIALHCSFRLSFFLTPNLIPCGSLPRSLFLFKPISQAGLAGSEHNVLAQEKDNTDRKRRAQPLRWTGSWVHCLVSLIRRRRKRQRRGDMVRQTRRAKLRLRRRNWLSVYIYIYI